MNLDQWLSRLESLHPAEIELGLERIKVVADRLGIEPGDAQVITVAGTNGKGSTCAMIDACLQAKGVTTGRYSSPHLQRFNERVLINGIEINDQQLIQAFEQVEHCRERISLTYFEFTTLAAFWIFQQQDLDVWVLEVGLGGRLDAVNIVDADVAVVTSIGLDHQDWLGTDLTQIGREKAGIARFGKPLVCGETENPQGVVETAQQVSAGLLLKGVDFSSQKQDQHWRFNGQLRSGEVVVFDDLVIPSLPLTNAATALQALVLLQWDWDSSTLNLGLQAATLEGRLQRFSVGDAQYVLDVAHNPQAAQMLVQDWQHRGWPKPVIILGMLSDKDVSGTMAELQALHPEHWWLVDLPGTRGQKASQLANYGAFAPHQYRTFESVADAMAESGRKSGLFLICGSFLTVGAALDALHNSR